MADAAADKPGAAKAGILETGPAALLLAEVARLKRELEEARARIAELELRADVDPLLDILNRRGFERELKRSLAYVKRYATPAALLYIDLDGFKTINDRHGHAAGDVLLKAVAGELPAHVRASDVVARLGGDEFGVLMWNAAEPQAGHARARSGDAHRSVAPRAWAGDAGGRRQRRRHGAARRPRRRRRHRRRRQGDVCAEEGEKVVVSPVIPGRREAPDPESRCMHRCRFWIRVRSP